MGRLGGVLGRLGAFLGRFGTLLEASWAILGRSWGPLGPSWSVGKPKRRQDKKHSKTQWKMNNFSLSRLSWEACLGLPGPSWRPRGPSWGLLRRLGALIRRLGALVGGPLAASWGTLGPPRSSWGRKARCFEFWVALLDPSWCRLGAPWGRLVWAPTEPRKEGAMQSPICFPEGGGALRRLQKPCQTALGIPPRPNAQARWRISEVRG